MAPVYSSPARVESRVGESLSWQEHVIAVAPFERSCILAARRPTQYEKTALREEHPRDLRKLCGSRRLKM